MADRPYLQCELTQFHLRLRYRKVEAKTVIREKTGATPAVFSSTNRPHSQNAESFDCG